MPPRTTLLLAAAALVLACAQRAHAQGGGAPAAPPAPDAREVVAASTGACGAVACRRSGWSDDRRRFEFSLPVWVPGVTGSLATATKRAESDGDFFERHVLASDAVTELKFAFVGRLELTHGRWWGLADLYAVDVGGEVDWNVGSTVTSVGLEATVGRAVVGYEVARWCAPGAPGALLTLTPFVGVRSYHVEIRIEDEAATRDWIDALLGLETHWWITPRWNVRLLLDVGTAVDTGWDVSWMATLEVHWRLSRAVSLFAGYTFLDLHHEHEERTRFEVDLTLAGPQLGLTVHF